MLGIIPEVAKFAGLPLDIRHVTLSSAFLTAAVASLGADVLMTKAFVCAAFGIAAIGLMNLCVSFYLAMFVATRACDIQSPRTPRHLPRRHQTSLPAALDFFVAGQRRADYTCVGLSRTCINRA